MGNDEELIDDVVEEVSDSETESAADLEEKSQSDETKSSASDEVKEEKDETEFTDSDYLKKIYELLSKEEEVEDEIEDEVEEEIEEKVETDSEKEIKVYLQEDSDKVDYSELIYYELLEKKGSDLVSNDFMNKPLIDYSPTESLLLVIILILLFRVFIKFIKENVWRWR